MMRPSVILIELSELPPPPRWPPIPESKTAALSQAASDVTYPARDARIGRLMGRSIPQLRSRPDCLSVQTAERTAVGIIDENAFRWVETAGIRLHAGKMTHWLDLRRQEFEELKPLRTAGTGLFEIKWIVWQEAESDN
jgi:hypothetical protein